MATRFYFKDFITGKIRYTRGQFVQWQKDGPLNAWGVLFANRASVAWVPEYLLTAESRAALPKRPS